MNTTPLVTLECALDAAPHDPLIHRAMAEAKRALGDELGALAHLIAAETLETFGTEPRSGSANGLCDVATGYFMKGDHEAALRWYQLVLMIEPNLAIAYLNLAAIHSSAGHLAEAESCRKRAYQIQRIFIEQAGDPIRRVLILCVGRTAGNVPFETILPTTTCSRIKYAIDYASDEEDWQLPSYDLVFNAVGEADVAVSLADRLDRFVRRCDRPVLNPPSVVARTQRHQLRALLGNLEGVMVAPCIRLERSPASSAVLADSLANSGLDFPILVRAAATHGGKGLIRSENIDELERFFLRTEGIFYLTSYYDYRCIDGYYRKYRIIFVDRKPFPYHLGISPHWMVHYFSADMEETPWKIEEERRFLEDPVAVLGQRAMATIVTIGRKLDLDYGGIDFALLPDGQVFVFEANATMLVHRERDNGVLTHKNRFVQNIVDAFEERMANLGEVAHRLLTNFSPI